MQKPDIEAIVSQHTQLRRLGHELRGLCPLHSEKTPSFYVDPEKQVFHCFGCGEGGDVIEFVRKLKDMSFHEAREYLGIDSNDHKPIANDPVESLAQSLSEWRRDVSIRIGDRCLLSFQRAEIAEQCDREEYSRLVREFAVLSEWQSSLWTAEGVIEMWESREAIERILV